MSRRRIGIVLMVVVFSGFMGYNRFFRPPPTAADIITLLSQQTMPGVVSLDGTSVAPPAAAPLRVVTIMPFGERVIAIYTNDQGQGSGLLERGWLGWDFRVYRWGPATAMT